MQMTLLYVNQGPLQSTTFKKKLSKKNIVIEHCFNKKKFTDQPLNGQTGQQIFKIYWYKVVKREKKKGKRVDNCDER